MNMIHSSHIRTETDENVTKIFVNSNPAQLVIDIGGGNS